LLRHIVDEVAGIAGKNAVDIEVISPLVLPESKTTPVSDLLAGEVLGHFGGFFDEKMRESDFVLGYRSALEWLSGAEGAPNALERHGLDPAMAREGEEAAPDA